MPPRLDLIEVNQIVILALAALFLEASPPLWVLGAGAGAGAAVAAVAIQAGTGLTGASWQGRRQTARWLCYLIAGTASAATLGVWLVLVILGCGLIELTVQLAGSRRPGGSLTGIVAAPALAAGAIGGGVLLSVAWVALKVGGLSFGGGFVIIPLMQSDAVGHYHWMTGAQFLNGASDVPMTASEQAAAKGGAITQVPVALGGEGIVYNLSFPAGARLHLTGPVLAGIFLGQITRWNDPALTALNPGVTLPSAAITVVHRSDGSGTTYIFSNYLSAVSPAWAAQVGTGKTLNWPTGEGDEGNGGVATEVNRTPFSIGYVEQAYSQGLTLPYAAIRNQAGSYVTPSAQSVAADAAQKPAITSADFSIVNQPGAASYPISGYSWALVYSHQPNQATGQTLVAMLDWLTHDGQASAAGNGYVPLPPQIQQLAHTTLQQITAPTGTGLLG